MCIVAEILLSPDEIVMSYASEGSLYRLTESVEEPKESERNPSKRQAVKDLNSARQKIKQVQGCNMYMYMYIQHVHACTHSSFSCGPSIA